MQVPRKCASLGIWKQWFHWYLVLHGLKAIIHLFQYKINVFFSMLFVKDLVEKKGENLFEKLSENIWRTKVTKLNT